MINGFGAKRHQIPCIDVCIAKSELDAGTCGNTDIGRHTGYGKQVSLLCMTVLDQHHQHLLVIGLGNGFVISQAPATDRACTGNIATAKQATNNTVYHQGFGGCFFS